MQSRISFNKKHHNVPFNLNDTGFFFNLKLAFFLVSTKASIRISGDSLSKVKKIIFQFYSLVHHRLYKNKSLKCNVTKKTYIH